MSGKKQGVAWLAIDSKGRWFVDGRYCDPDVDKHDGISAEGALDFLEPPGVYALHRIVFDMPDSPKEISGELTADVGEAEEGP